MEPLHGLLQKCLQPWGHRGGLGTEGVTPEAPGSTVRSVAGEVSTATHTYQILCPYGPKLPQSACPSTWQPRGHSLSTCQAGVAPRPSHGLRVGDFILTSLSLSKEP